MNYDPYKSIWLNPNIEYLFNDDIYEYDIHDAGMSIIKQFKLLPEAQINELMQLEKFPRHIAVGKIQKNDKVFSKKLVDGFANVRNIFVSKNNLTSSKIISVKKDAIFTIGECEYLKFGAIEFAPKNKYSSYIRFTDNNNIELYYHNKSADIKGMSDIAIAKHRLFMLEFILKVISYIESNNSYVKRYIMSYIKSYKAMELEEEYYYEFNNISRDYNPMFNYTKIILPLIQIISKEMST